MFAYNNQRDNIFSKADWAKQMPGWAQCMSTCAFMLLSYYVKGIQGDDDGQLSYYLQQLEFQLDPAMKKQSKDYQLKLDDFEQAKYARDFLKENKTYWNAFKNDWFNKWTSEVWAIHQYALSFILKAYDVPGVVIYRETNGTWQELIGALTHGPAMLATYKLGGLPGGHIILPFQIQKKNSRFVDTCDPFGDARTGYTLKDGNMVAYDIFKLKANTENIPDLQKGCIRYIYVDQNI